MTIDWQQAWNIVREDALGVDAAWRNLHGIWAPFADYARSVHVTRGQRLDGPRLSAFTDAFAKALQANFNVVTTRTSAPIPGGGMAHEVFAIKPCRFSMPGEGESFSLSCIHLLATPGRLRLQSYDTPYVWLHHFGQRGLYRGGESEVDPTLHAAKRLMRTAPFLAAVRSVCSKNGSRRFTAPYGKGLLMGSFAGLDGLVRSDLETILFDFGIGNDFPVGSGRAPLPPTAVNFDFDDPFAIPIVRTYLAPDMLTPRQRALRDRLSEVEARFSGTIGASLTKIFRPVSEVDPVAPFLPDPDLANAIEDVFDSPEFGWYFGRNLVDERLQAGYPSMRVA